MSYIVEIGKNIVRLRKERGMSQELLADSAGISTDVYKRQAAGGQ